jgi:fumarylacetoacetate (FAA) hydrolase
MKLASLKHGRDGRLVVVSRDLMRCADASAVAPTLQAALDEWAAAEPRLTEIADALEAGRIAHMPFDQVKCASPLPRSHTAGPMVRLTSITLRWCGAHAARNCRRRSGPTR